MSTRASAFFFSSRRRHTRSIRDWSSDVCSSDLSGSITLHPRGIPHGPHPGTIMASRNATRTEELAVMFDTQHTLELTEDSLALDDPKYPQRDRKSVV